MVEKYFWKFNGPLYSELGNLFYDHSEPRVLTEILPHYTQCILMLFMALERYILICHPTSAQQLLSRERRIVLYSFVTLSIITLCTTLSCHYWATVFDIRPGDINPFDNVGSHSASKTLSHKVQF